MGAMDENRQLAPTMADLERVWTILIIQCRVRRWRSRGGVFGHPPKQAKATAHAVGPISLHGAELPARSLHGLRHNLALRANVLAARFIGIEIDPPIST